MSNCYTCYDKIEFYFAFSVEHQKHQESQGDEGGHLEWVWSVFCLVVLIVHWEEVHRGVAVVSPIRGVLYRGAASLREYCPLKGDPPVHVSRTIDLSAIRTMCKKTHGAFPA